MELQQAIYQRRSVRGFLDKNVEREKVEQLIESGIQAPSACNRQAWKFIIVDDIDIKNKIVDFGGSILIKQAPTGILVLYQNQTLGKLYDDNIQSAAAAIENILLKAVELGLGACWICHLPKPSDLRKIFKIPNGFSPIAYILLGYPSKEAQNVSRKYSLREVMNYNEFDPNWPLENISTLSLLIKKILVKIYYLSPVWLKKLFLNKFLDKYFVKKFEN